MHDASNQGDATPPIGNLPRRCNHPMEQIGNAPKIVDEFIKLTVNKVMFRMIKTLDNFLDCQRKRRKATPKRPFIKDRTGITKTGKELLPDYSAKRDSLTKPPTYRENKYKDSRETLNRERAK